jgi:23S rRNA A2030 N6-methylase RlmJ
VTLADLRDNLRALLPHTPIDIAGNRLLVTFAEPIHVIGIAVREDFSDYELGFVGVWWSIRSKNQTPATAEHIAENLRAKVRLRLYDLRSAANNGSPWQKATYAKALDIIAATDLAAVAIDHLNTEIREIAKQREALEVNTARKVAALDKEAEALAERRRALVMLAPGYDGPKLEPLSEYTDTEILLDEGDDGEA